MTKTLLTLVVTFSFITSYAQTDWKKYDYKAYNFSVNFIHSPELSVDTTTFENAPLITYSWEVDIADTLHQNNYYSVSLTSYPSSFIHSDSLPSVVEGFLNSSQNSIQENKSYTLLSSSLTEKNGYPGKIYKWKNDSTNVFFEFQVYLVENKLFQLSVVSRAGENHNVYIDRYFDSFNLLDLPKGKFTLPKNLSKKSLAIEFPGEPKQETKTVDSELGKLTLDIQTFEPKEGDDNIVYIAMETSYPTSVVDQDNTYELNAFYKKSIDGSLKSVNGELISINDIYYKGKLGKEYKAYFSEGKVLMVYRFYYLKDTLYSVGVITLPEKDKNKRMTDFFESFNVKE